jgi:TPR repeat protein
MSRIPIQISRLRDVAIAAGCMGIVSSVALASPFEDGDAAYWRHDYAEALRILRPLADQGDTNAQADMGFMNLYGFGVEKNGGQAVIWFFRSADNGNPKAQAMLGHLYLSGDAGVSRDLSLIEGLLIRVTPKPNTISALSTRMASAFPRTTSKP